MVLMFFFYLSLEVKTSPFVFLPQGSITAIITHLKNNNFDVNNIDKQLLRFFGSPQSGLIDLGVKASKYGAISKGDFLYKLVNAKAAQDEVRLIPGETMYFFIKETAYKLNLNENLLLDAFNKYSPLSEGVILPNTYKVPFGINEDELMKLLVTKSLKEHENLAKSYIGFYNEKKWFEIVSMAAIIQKEASSIEEMPLVSAVIHNRLELNMPLQMDGSLNYGEFSHSKVTPQRIRNDLNQCNTYKFKGVPKLPCGSASIEAIRAAINPANVDYLYFVRTKNGKHTFSKTYKEHRELFDK